MFPDEWQSGGKNLAFGGWEVEMGGGVCLKIKFFPLLLIKQDDINNRTWLMIFDKWLHSAYILWVSSISFYLWMIQNPNTRDSGFFIKLIELIVNTSGYKW